jgi:hypothetical protein
VFRLIAQPYCQVQACAVPYQVMINEHNIEGLLLQAVLCLEVAGSYFGNGGSGAVETPGQDDASIYKILNNQNTQPFKWIV